MMSFKWNAILVAATAWLVIFLPRHFREEPPIVIHGEVDRGFEKVLSTFRANFENGADSRYGGSALAVYHKGKKIIDIWGGFADVESNQEWKEDTMTMAFSATKGIASICIAMLVDRGLLNYDKPVSQYWPEFAQKGKDKITVRELMEHKAGLTLMPSPGMSVEVLRDVARAGELMASATPQWEFDGVKHGYHAFTFGPLTNELLRRVDPQHRTMGRFFEEEVAKPFGVDFHIGLPFDQNYRVARLNDGTTVNIWSHLKDVIGQVVFKIIASPHLFDMFKNVHFGDNQDMDMPFKLWYMALNNPQARAVELPSASGIGTARSLAKIYGILSSGGIDPVTKKMLISKGRINGFMNASLRSNDEVLGFPLTHTLGMVTTDYFNLEIALEKDVVTGFGHPGAGGQYAWANPENQIGFSFISSSMMSDMGQSFIRVQNLIDAVYKCLNS